MKPGHRDALPFLPALLKLQQLASGAIILVMALMVAVEVICRALFGFSLLIVEEVGGYLLAALVFLGMGLALSEGGLFRVEFVIKALSPRKQLALQCFFDALCALAMAMLSWQLGSQVYESYIRGTHAATTLGTPLYIPQSVMVFGSFSTTLVLVSQFLRGAARLRSADE
jgi:TRAP-type C4-dicarboxylate transport system permease small subunit